MIDNKMFPEERRQKILTIVNNNGRVDVLELANEFKASVATIRTDLNYLAVNGDIKRTHGGAILLKRSNIVEKEIPVIEKENIAIEGKIKMAKAALEFIENKQSIFLDIGSTVYQFAKLLSNKHGLSIITNSFRIANEVSRYSDKELIFIGGVFREKTQATSGPLAMKVLEEIYVHTFFMSVSGIDFKNGLTTSHISEAEIKKKMIEKAQKVIVLADSSKFNKVDFARVCAITDVDIIITDNISKENEASIKDLGVKLIIA
ncbi:MAG: DeoR/GlpR family DNA-binding transcription regulator [Candidatus Firestonebacteria bacterium]